MRVVVVHLYPQLMSIYGDRGNILALVRRCQWRGIEVEVAGVEVGERLQPGSFDLLFIGGGQDREQSVVGRDLVEVQAEPLAEAVAGGAVVLAVCGGYQLLGKYFRTRTGEEIPGTGLFDAWTVAGDRRHIGNVVVRCAVDGQERDLVGFENHSGRTYLGPGCRPLGRVVVGAGNNGEDGTEGAVFANAYGTYLHGSLLPKNPWFADLLIAKALARRYGSEVELPPLDDHLETAAHMAAARRARATSGRRSGAW
ncbi:MAG TPA: glutamine amidotransferase [Chloroflexota bacterium]